MKIRIQLHKAKQHAINSMRVSIKKVAIVRNNIYISYGTSDINVISVNAPAPVIVSGNIVVTGGFDFDEMFAATKFLRTYGKHTGPYHFILNGEYVNSNELYRKGDKVYTPGGQELRNDRHF